MKRWSPDHVRHYAKTRTYLTISDIRRRVKFHMDTEGVSYTDEHEQAIWGAFPNVERPTFKGVTATKQYTT